MQAPVPSLNSETSETAWVESELIRQLMIAARGTPFVAVALIPLMAGILWGNTPQWALNTWIVAIVGVLIARVTMMTRYYRAYARDDLAGQQAFLGRQRMIWPLSGILWGATAALFMDYAPVAEQFLCWLGIAGIGTYAIKSLSGNMKVMYTYVTALSLTVLLVVGWHIVVIHRFDGPSYHYWLWILVLVYWQSLVHVGRQAHRALRKGLELQYRNTQLIDSLMRQTQAALDAMSIKNRFLASAAHDIRQPVHALALYADWLSSEPEMAYEIAPKILQATKAVNALFDSLFDLVRLDSGQVKVNLEPVNIGKLLRELEIQYRPIAESKGIELRVRPVNVTVVSDRIFLQRILGNLLSNAVKFTSNGGVVIAARKTHEGVRVDIHDTGIGIETEHHANVFREFYKVSAHGGTDDGFGLGLAIVSRLSAAIGHKLTMRSRPGRGTSFRLELRESDTAELMEEQYRQALEDQRKSAIQIDLDSR